MKHLGKSKKKLKKNSVLITGHTGFIGSWLYYVLKKKKFKVYGVALAPKSNYDLFYKLGLEKDKNSKILDILNYDKLHNHVKKIKPKIIIHLAAESLVLESLKKPSDTYQTNIVGTLNILKLIRKYNFISSGIFFTTDKVYKNSNKKKKFIENDKLGGDDPYSGSKSASELVINSFSKTFLLDKKIVTLRCGNVIGGGDNCKYRIVPDIINSIKRKKILFLRNPNSTRPWQYILDVIFGLHEIILKLDKKKKFFDCYNMSSNSKSVSVKYLVSQFQKEFKLKYKIKYKKNIEKNYLDIDSSKLFNHFKIKNILTAKNSIKRTVQFYKKNLIKKKPLNEIINEEIINYENKTKNF